MNDSWLTWLLVVEIAFPFILLSIVLIAILIRNKSRYKDAMRELIINVKDNEPVRIEATQRFLHEKLGLAESEVEKLASDIIKERKFFFRTFVASILNKDVENLATLDEELSRITEKYHALTPNISSTAAESAPADVGGDTSALQSELESKQAEIEQLNQEMKGLKQEVHITLTTLNNIFAEYSSMFGEEVARKDMSVEQILTAMEAFSGTKGETESSPEPVDVSKSAEETETVDDLELEEASEDDTSALDKMPLEDVSESEDEPSWEDAFDESGEEMTKEPD